MKNYKLAITALAVLSMFLMLAACEDKTNNLANTTNGEQTDAGGGDSGNIFTDPKNGQSDRFNAAKVDSLVVYWPRRYDVNNGITVFKSAAELTDFFERSGYNLAGNVPVKEMTLEPDFEKWTYFAYVDPMVPVRWDGISVGGDTVTVSYTKIIQRWSLGPNCPEGYPFSVARPMPMIYVYFMPFTDKPIAFAEAREYVPEVIDCDRY